MVIQLRLSLEISKALHYQQDPNYGMSIAAGELSVVSDDAYDGQRGLLI